MIIVISNYYYNIQYYAMLLNINSYLIYYNDI